MLLPLAALSAWAVSVTSTPGQLSQAVTDHSVTELTVAGALDVRDFAFIADKLPALASLDISDAEIVAYTFTADEQYFGCRNSSAANALPGHAFFGSSISNIALPEQLTEIGDAAFAACANLQSISIPANVTRIGDNAFNASADSFILANANAANAKLCAVVRKSGSDLNRYLTESDGELNFNAIVINVPETAAYLKENLHLRAFVVCGGVTYYSAVKTDSVYNAVKRVSADPNYANDPYIRRIIELCETTNG